MTVAGLYISKSVELARHLAYVQPRIPDVLTAGIRDNGNLARVYSAGNRGVGESGVWFLFPLLRQRHRVIVHLLCSLC